MYLRVKLDEYNGRPYRLFRDDKSSEIVADTIGCVKLWKAMLALHLKEALNKRDSTAGQQHEAYHWITGNNSTFKIACIFAGYEPTIIRRNFIELYNSKWGREIAA